MILLLRRTIWWQQAPCTLTKMDWACSTSKKPRLGNEEATPNIFQNQFSTSLSKQCNIYKSTGSEVSSSIKRKQSRLSERSHQPKTVCLQSSVQAHQKWICWWAGNEFFPPIQSVFGFSAGTLHH